MSYAGNVPKFGQNWNVPYKENIKSQQCTNWEWITLVILVIFIIIVLIMIVYIYGKTMNINNTVNSVSTMGNDAIKKIENEIYPFVQKVDTEIETATEYLVTEVPEIVEGIKQDIQDIEALINTWRSP